MTIVQYAAIIISAAVVISYLNYRYIKMQATIAIMASALLLSLILLLTKWFGVTSLRYLAQSFVLHIDFHRLVMNFMLGLLLFAGSLTINISHFRSQKIEIGVLTSITTILSAFLIAFLTYLFLGLIGVHFDFIYCMLFGSLISPTDPVAVLAIFKKLGTPKRLETLVSSESLFNDGVGVVLFVTCYQVAFSSQAATVSGVIGLFFKEAAGGVLYGMLLGWICCLLMKPVNDHKVKILLTIALVTGGYTLAQALQISGPLAMVAAGIIVSNYKRGETMSKFSRGELNNFWELIDELLNTVLFLLLGLELLVVTFDWRKFVALFVMIPLVLLVRYITVATPMAVLSRWRRRMPYTISILTWGGLRGGLAVALALSIPSGDVRDWILALTYGVVVFSIVVQGTTISGLVRLANASHEKHKANLKSLK